MESENLNLSYCTDSAGNSAYRTRKQTAINHLQLQ